MSVDISKIDRETKQAIVEEAWLAFLDIPTERQLEKKFGAHIKIRIDDTLVEQIAMEAAERIILEKVQEYKKFVTVWQPTIAQRIINVRKEFYEAIRK